ncbi:MAG: hypothetical protein WEC39_01960 [Patescibacteria group bacterium]
MSVKQLFWWVILILLFASLLGGAAYAFYYFYYLPNQKPAENSQDNPLTEEGPQLKTFNGEFVQGKSPEGWAIVEYKDGQGTTMLTGGVIYTGLTGLEIKNPGGEAVFSLHGVYGIGGVETCMSYFRFADDSPTYYNSIATQNTQAGEIAPAVVDLTTTPYSPSNLFGTTIRRIGTKLYWDTQSGTTTFEAACGISENIFRFSSPKFATGTLGSQGDYHYVVLATATTEDLTALDTILNSLTVNP